MTSGGAWMPLYVGDYLGDTQRLSTEQHGAYLLLLMDYWRNGPPPADDDVLCQITKLAKPAWRKMKAIILRFFEERDGVLIHHRVEDELSKASQQQERRTDRARKAASARWGSSEDATSNATSISSSNARTLPRAHGPQSQSQSPESSQPSVPDTARSEIDRLVEDLLVCSGIASRAPSTLSAAQSQVEGWQRDGIDIEATVKPVIRQVIAASDEPSHSLRRFDKAVRHEHAKRPAPKPRSSPKSAEEQAAELDQRAAFYRSIDRDGEAEDCLRKAERLRRPASIGELVGRISSPHSAAGGRG